MMPDLLLSELLRPTAIPELLLPSSIIRRLEPMATIAWPMNLLFYGPPGSGKTSASRVIGGNDLFDHLEVRGSSLRDAGSLAEIEAFAASMSFTGRGKVCVIDEADAMSKAADRALRPLIEMSHDNCRFILTANEIDSLSDATRSRLLPIYFRLLGSEKDEAFTRWAPLYLAKLRDVGIEMDERQLRKVLDDKSWDLRAVANFLEFSRPRNAA
jgi:DNA polymerase III delta prime subunit